MKTSAKLAVVGLLVALLAGCATLHGDNYGRIFTGRVGQVNNHISLALLHGLIERNHIDMSKNDLAAVTVEQGFTANIHAGVFTPKSVHLQPGDLVEFQNATKDREYSVFMRVIQRADEKGPCRWDGTLWGKSGGVVCNE